MKIVYLDKKNIKYFEKFVPSEIIYPMERAEQFILGVAEDEGKLLKPAGILVFDILGDQRVFENDEPIDDVGLFAYIRWIYVDRQYRNKGCANALMQAMYDVLNENGIENVVSDISISEEDDDVCLFLEHWGLVFSLVRNYDFRTTIEEISATGFLQQKVSAAGIKPLSDISQKDFTAYIKSFDAYAEVPEDLSIKIEHYEQDISFVHCRPDGSITASFLLELHGDVIYAKFLRSKENKPARIMMLLIYAMEASFKKYKPETEVVVLCRNEMTANLIAKIFPDAQPVMMRRGIYLDEEEKGFWMNRLQLDYSK